MSKLHEIIAVEPDLKATATRVTTTIQSLFLGGKERLTGQVRKYRPMEDGGETFVDEVTELATTSAKELAQFQTAFGDWMDVAVQKEVTNSNTKADVVLRGKNLLTGLTAPALLNLESKLSALRSVYEAIPTNDPSERWEYSTQEGCYISPARDSYRTKKVVKSIILAPATVQHPAQVQAFNEDERAGTWTTVKRSGMLSPIEKRDLLSRIDELIRAVKGARQRANDVEVINVKVADVLFRYINTGE